MKSGSQYTGANDEFRDPSPFFSTIITTYSDLYERVKETNQTIMEIKLPAYIYHHETEDPITNKMYPDMKSSEGLQNILTP
jgi:hypothetical protein